VDIEPLGELVRFRRLGHAAAVGQKGDRQRGALAVGGVELAQRAARGGQDLFAPDQHAVDVENKGGGRRRRRAAGGQRPRSLGVAGGADRVTSSQQAPGEQLRDLRARRHYCQKTNAN
jgi:hypothetical protein